MSVGHYENFPVASLALPRPLRPPVKAIYAFARTADDLADEGNAADEQRLEALDKLRQSLEVIETGTDLKDPMLRELGRQINDWNLPVQPFHDLLDAFSQDVTKTRYANFGEVIHYCRRSANPIGRLLLHLYKQTDSKSMAYSDGICSALQIINFLQDIAIDWQKGRVYLPQDEMALAGINDTMLGKLLGDVSSIDVQSSEFKLGKPLKGIPIVSSLANPELCWRNFMLAQIKRTRNMLQAGAPLGLILKGRIGFELRMIIAGGDRILRKLHADPLCSLKQRPTLNPWDWTVMFTRALLKK